MRDFEGHYTRNMTPDDDEAAAAATISLAQHMNNADSENMQPRSTKLENFLSHYIKEENPLIPHAEGKVFCNNTTLEQPLTNPSAHAQSLKSYDIFNVGYGAAGNFQPASTMHLQNPIDAVLTSSNHSSYANEHLISMLPYTSTICTTTSNTHITSARNASANSNSTSNTHIANTSLASESGLQNNTNLLGFSLMNSWMKSQSLSNTENDMLKESNMEVMKEGSFPILPLFEASQLTLSMTPSIVHANTTNPNDATLAVQESSSTTTDSKRQSPDPTPANVVAESTPRKSIESFGQRTSIYRGVTK